jgi:hypothetical protein
VSTNRNLVLNPIFQAELQRLVTPQLPDSRRRIPPPSRLVHLTLQGLLLNIDTDSRYLCALTHPSYWMPRGLRYDPLDSWEPPLASCVVAVVPTHEMRAILGQQRFRAFLAEWQGHLGANALNLPGPGNPMRQARVS